jgi:hypothetical protein
MPVSPESSRRRLSFAAAPHVTALAAFAALAVLANSVPLGAQSLVGSHESMMRQNMVAQQHDYAYLRTASDVMQAVESGVLVAVQENSDLQLAGDEVSFPYARPEVKTFLEQLAREYHAACGEPLVVTSLTRPITLQPWNASPISVHPTGMACDLRRSERHACRQWIERTLLALNGEGMIDAIRERWPPHYHVAIFPDPLLLPGPIGDPNGVARLAALHQISPGSLQEVDNESSAQSSRVHVVRSSRTGRLRITQTGRAVARRTARSGDGRLAVRGTRHGRAGAHSSKGSRTSHGGGANRQAVVRHHRYKPAPPATSTAR